MRDYSEYSIAKPKVRSSRHAMAFAGFSAIASILMFASAQASPPENKEARPSSGVDYPTFQALTDDAAIHRQNRLVTLEQFQEMGRLEDTIILDTRSKWAFDLGHIEGAVNLNFSDFTDDKLAEIIPDFDTRILIYCNNNFSDDITPVPKKMVSLALNIPTFINLYGYGYTNIYELGDEVSMQELGEYWVATPLEINTESEL